MHKKIRNKFIENLSPAEFPLVGRTNEASAYLYMCRDWYMSGYDVGVISLNDNGRVHRFCQGTGPWIMTSMDAPPPIRTAYDDVVPFSTWRRAMALADSIGLVDYASYYADGIISTADFTDAFLLQLPGRDSHHFFLRYGPRRGNKADRKLVRFFEDEIGMEALWTVT